MNMTKILVTGASGFVGIHMLDALVSGSRTVIALHNRPLAEHLRDRYKGKVTWRQFDIVNDDLSAVVADIDTVYHLAAYASNSESSEDVALMEQVNILGTKRLSFASRNAGVRHFIFVSSVAAGSNVLDEEDVLSLSPYGRSKREAETKCLELSTTDFGVTVLRPSALFGEYHEGSVYELVKVINQRRFFMVGDGRNRTNFYYIGDFIELLLLLEHKDEVYGQIFVACVEPWQLKNLVLEIEMLLGVNHMRWHVPVFVGYLAGFSCDIIRYLTGYSLPLSSRRIRAMQQDIAYSANRLEATLKFKPKFGLKDGLRRTISWFRKEELL
jgi:nucleoside-diphosphate-sugar epimerase